MNQPHENKPESTDVAARAAGAAHRKDALPGVESRKARTAKVVVPWIASAALHASLIALGFLVTWTVVIQSKDDPVTIVADFDMLHYDPVLRLDPVPDHDEPAEQPLPELDFLPPIEPLDPVENPAAHGLEPLLDAFDAPPTDFAPPAAEGSAEFLGVSATNARRIVYVIDASGSMIAYLQFILQELARSLDALSPRQRFSIVFFQRNEAVVVPPGRLVPAESRELRRALDWSRQNVIPAGRSNPLAALDHAMRLQPDVVFILSVNITGAGYYEIDQSELLERLDRMNPLDAARGQRRTQINCIQFLDPDPLDTLRVIAELHGGAKGYKFLSRQELGLTVP